jgi:TRAP-type mannitol/chloroaromatic compound transport system permease small subunit
MDPRAIAEFAGPIAVFALATLAPFLLLPLAILFGGRFAADIAEPATQMIEWISAWAERLAQALLALMALLVGLVVVLRYAFGVSSNALQESTLYAHAFAFLLASAAALGRDGHVRVDVFYARLAPKRKAAVDLFAYCVFVVPMLIAILHYSGPFVERSWRIGERSAEADGLAGLFLLKTAIPIFAVLLLAQALAEACRNACVLRAIPPAPRRFPRDEAHPG